VFPESQFAWPVEPGSGRDLRALPDPDSGDVDFYYGTRLSAGYAAISYPAEGVGFGLSFDPKVLDSLCVFATHGGWRGLNTVIIEPCSGYPADLNVAIARG
jgi:hypothetical protein